jgi:hypothetical protein
MLAGAECEWTKLPNDIIAELHAGARIASSSKPIEDFFNFARGQTEGVRNGKQSAMQVWHSALNSGIMEENDLNPISISAVDEVASDATLPKAVFEAKHGQEDFSLGPDMRDSFFSDTDYPSHPCRLQGICSSRSGTRHCCQHPASTG